MGPRIPGRHEISHPRALRNRHHLPQFPCPPFPALGRSTKARCRLSARGLSLPVGRPPSPAFLGKSPAPPNLISPSDLAPSTRRHRTVAINRQNSRTSGGRGSPCGFGLICAADRFDPLLGNVATPTKKREKSRVGSSPSIFLGQPLWAASGRASSAGLYYVLKLLTASYCGNGPLSNSLLRYRAV